MSLHSFHVILTFLATCLASNFIFKPSIHINTLCPKMLPHTSHFFFSFLLKPQTFSIKGNIPPHAHSPPPPPQKKFHSHVLKEIMA